MRIGIFGGSFDPVHIEHVRMASSAIECLRLDKLYVVPAAQPPHKPWKRMTEDGVRLRALEIAFQEIEKAEICPYEIEQQGTSYTYLTCRYFRQKYPTAQLFFLVGTDMLRDFPSWKEPKDILSNATLAVCARAEEQGWQEREQAAFMQRFGQPFTSITYEGKAVSSTKLRVLLAADCTALTQLPKGVEDYLRKTGVYQVKGAAEALALEKQSRAEHSLRVAYLAAERAPSLGIDERRAITAALFHDCAKNLEKDSPLLEGFSVDEPVPAPVLHQFTGAYVARTAFGIEDREVLDAIAYHTSGRARMSTLEKLTYLADALEEGRTYAGVERLRTLFWKKDGLDECLRESLKSSLEKVRGSGEVPYRLTQEAYEYYAKGD